MSWGGSTGRNIRVDSRWSAGDVGRVQIFAKELVQLNPDALVAITTPATDALQAETQTVPIVFAMVSDPVGSRLVASFAKPGANITGFVNIEASLSGKTSEPCQSERWRGRTSLRIVHHVADRNSGHPWTVKRQCLYRCSHLL